MAAAATNSEFGFDAEMEITLPELDYIEAKFAAERSSGEVSEDTHFMYAWALLRSRYRDDRLLAIEQLQEIMKKYPNKRRECLLYLALTNYKIGEYRTGLKYVNELLDMEPTNYQALQLKDKIEKKVTNDGVIGLALVGGLAAAAVGVMIAAYRSRRN